MKLLSLRRNSFYGVLWKEKLAEIVDFFNVAMFTWWWEKSKLCCIFKIVPSSVHYFVLLSETFMMLQDASFGVEVTLPASWASKQNRNIKKLLKHPIWKVVIDNSPKPFRITHANHLISQYSGTNRIIPSQLSFQTMTFQKKVLSLSSMMSDIGWKENCLKQSLTMRKESFVIYRSSTFPIWTFKAKFCGSWI